MVERTMKTTIEIPEPLLDDVCKLAQR